MITFILTLSVVLVGSLIVVYFIRLRNMQYWLPAYITQRLKKNRHSSKTVKHVYFCFADHYEPYYNNATPTEAKARVDKWLQNYPALAKQFTDSDGKHPQHSFFYPEEEYDEQLVQNLSDMCHEGYGDIEVHLHHDNDTADGLTQKLLGFKKILHDRHNCLSKDEKTGEIIYAFIHGNWALDNSRPDGRWCGVDNELDVLVNTGCYMDMTMPSAPSDTQTKKINSIYFAKGKVGCRKSHDEGRDVKVGGKWAEPGELLIVQGPLALNWRNRKWGILPKIESSELSQDCPPNLERIKLWGGCEISVKGAEEHVFIKVHTHGATEENAKMLFDDGGFVALWKGLEDAYKGTNGCQLHYVTAGELYDKVRSLSKYA
jgi:hypothetical protein